MDHSWLVLFPGLALPPVRYTPLLNTFEERLDCRAIGYATAGVWPRLSDRTPVSPGGMAAEVIADLAPEEGPRVYVGHSLGAHAARAAAMADPLTSALVMLDPNLGTGGRYDPSDFDVPTVLTGWRELEATYARAGIPPERVPREWWRERPDGSISRAFDLEVIRAQLDAVPFGDEILRAITSLSERLPVAIVRTTRQSVNTEADWDRLVTVAPKAAIIDVEAYHALPAGEQAGVAEAIVRWYREA